MQSTAQRLMAGAAGKKSSLFASDPGVYAYVPYSATDSTYTSLLLLNTTTGAVDSTITAIASPSSVRIIRFGQYVLQANVHNYNTDTIRDALTNTLTASGTFPTAVNDVVKFQSDKLAVLYMSSNTIKIGTYSVSSTLSSIGDFSLATMSDYRSGYSSPQFGAQITMNSNAVFSSYSGILGLACVESYIGGATVTYFATISLNSAGTSASVSNSFTTSDNFSRPVCASGDNGYCLVSKMDMGSSYIFNGSTVTGNVNTYGNENTNYAPAAIHGASGQYMLDTVSNSVRKLTTSGHTTSLSLPSSPTYGRTIQTIKNGCVLIYSNAGAIYYRTYNRSSDTWSSELSISGYSSGYVNRTSAVVKKVMNY